MDLRQRVLLQVQKLPYRVYVNLDPSEWREMQSSPCQICKHDTPEHERGYHNVATTEWKKGIISGNVRPVCEMCWKLRSGMTDDELRRKCGQITANLANDSLRRAAVSKALETPGPLNSRQKQVLRNTRRRMLSQCGLELDNKTLKAISKMLRCPCHYCGEKSVGLDRLDSFICPSYELTNLVPCCKLCNSMKHTLTKNQFLSHVQKISLSQKSYE